MGALRYGPFARRSPITASADCTDVASTSGAMDSLIGASSSPTPSVVGARADGTEIALRGWHVVPHPKRPLSGILFLDTKAFCGQKAMIDEGRWEHAGFGDRLFGEICDGFIAAFVFLSAYFLVDRRILGNASGFLSDDGLFGTADVVAWVWFLWNLTYLVGRNGQSWGRKVAGLKVVNSDGASIGFWRALGRNLFAAFVSAPFLYLGFLWVIWDGQKQAWHDKVFRTYVVRRVSG